MKGTVLSFLGFWFVAAAGCAGVSQAKYDAVKEKLRILRMDRADKKAYDTGDSGGDSGGESGKNSKALEAKVARLRRQVKSCRASRAARARSAPGPSKPVAAARQNGKWNGAVTGNMDVAAVRSTVAVRMRKIKRCYRKYLAKHPNANKTFDVHFQIKRSGKVRKFKISKSELSHRRTVKCLKKVFKRLRFPKHNDSERVRVRFPLTII